MGIGREAVLRRVPQYTDLDGAPRRVVGDDVSFTDAAGDSIRYNHSPTGSQRCKEVAIRGSSNVQWPPRPHGRQGVVTRSGQWFKFRKSKRFELGAM